MWKCGKNPEKIKQRKSETDKERGIERKRDTKRAKRWRCDTRLLVCARALLRAQKLCQSPSHSLHSINIEGSILSSKAQGSRLGIGLKSVSAVGWKGERHGVLSFAREGMGEGQGWQRSRVTLCSRFQWNGCNNVGCPSLIAARLAAVMNMHPRLRVRSAAAWREAARRPFSSPSANANHSLHTALPQPWSTQRMGLLQTAQSSTSTHRAAL